MTDWSEAESRHTSIISAERKETSSPRGGVFPWVDMPRDFLYLESIACTYTVNMVYLSIDMIITFLTEATRDIYDGKESKQARRIPQSIWKVAPRKLDMLNVAYSLNDLKAPPANRLEALRGNLKGKYSIRINDQYRIVFEFRDKNVYEVEITDYH